MLNGLSKLFNDPPMTVTEVQSKKTAFNIINTGVQTVTALYYDTDIKGKKRIAIRKSTKCGRESLREVLAEEGATVWSKVGIAVAIWTQAGVRSTSTGSHGGGSTMLKEPKLQVKPGTSLMMCPVASEDVLIS